MPRSTIANRTNKTYDNLLELRSYGAAALSATGSSTGVALDTSRINAAKVVLNIAAYTGTFAAGSLQWAVSVEVATTVGGTYTVVETVVPQGTAIYHEVPLTNAQVLNYNSNPQFIRVTATKTGAPGNLVYGAFVTDIV